MNKLTWELLVEVNGRLQADLLQSHLEAQGIDVELFQEAVGRHIYPVTVDGLGLVQIFVPNNQLHAARKILAKHSEITARTG